MSYPESDPLPRREFARMVASGIGGLTLGTSTAPVVAQEPPAEPPKPPSVPTLILAQIVTDCPSEHWNDDTLGSLMGDIRGDLARGKSLRSVPLSNADEPGPVFAAYRGPDKKA